MCTFVGFSYTVYRGRCKNKSLAHAKCCSQIAMRMNGQVHRYQIDSTRLWFCLRAFMLTGVPQSQVLVLTVENMRSMTWSLLIVRLFLMEHANDQLDTKHFLQILIYTGTWQCLDLYCQKVGLHISCHHNEHATCESYMRRLPNGGTAHSLNSCFIQTKICINTYNRDPSQRGRDERLLLCQGLLFCATTLQQAYRSNDQHKTCHDYTTTTQLYLKAFPLHLEDNSCSGVKTLTCTVLVRIQIPALACIPAESILNPTLFWFERQWGRPRSLFLSK